jgi:hypothetical protein
MVAVRNHRKARCARPSNSGAANSLSADQPPYAPGKLPSLRPNRPIRKPGRNLADVNLLEHLICALK